MWDDDYNTLLLELHKATTKCQKYNKLEIYLDFVLNSSEDQIKMVSLSKLEYYEFNLIHDPIYGKILRYNNKIPF